MSAFTSQRNMVTMKTVNCQQLIEARSRPCARVGQGWCFWNKISRLLRVRLSVIQRLLENPHVTGRIEERSRSVHRRSMSVRNDRAMHLAAHQIWLLSITSAIYLTGASTNTIRLTWDSTSCLFSRNGMPSTRNLWWPMYRLWDKDVWFAEANISHTTCVTSERGVSYRHL